MIPVNRPLIDEVDISNVLENLNNTMISGEINDVQAAEKALAKKMNVAGAALVNSGTSAIDLAVEAIDIQESDECILPTFTIIATATNLLRKKAKLILVDAEPRTWGMKEESTLEAITNVTKLILPVHIYGLPVDM